MHTAKETVGKGSKTRHREKIESDLAQSPCASVDPQKSWQASKFHENFKCRKNEFSGIRSNRQKE